MKKREILNFIFIIYGIHIIVFALDSLARNLTDCSFYNHVKGTNYQFGIIILVLIIILIGLFLITKNHLLSKLLIKDDADRDIALSLKKDEVLHVAIIFICLYFILSYFPAVVNEISLLSSDIINSRTPIGLILPHQIISILLFILLVIGLIYSKKISFWLEKKISTRI